MVAAGDRKVHLQSQHLWSAATCRRFGRRRLDAAIYSGTQLSRLRQSGLTKRRQPIEADSKGVDLLFDRQIFVSAATLIRDVVVSDYIQPKPPRIS
jgi:hypothetical protein